MRRALPLVVLSLTLSPLVAPAETSRQAFDLRNAGDLAELCAAPEDDPIAESARSFCFGFLAGAYQYAFAVYGGKGDRVGVCLPDPRPSRAEAARGFVAWSKTHPQHMQEPAVDALLRFAQATWPCSKKAR